VQATEIEAGSPLRARAAYTARSVDLIAAGSQLARDRVPVGRAARPPGPTRTP
jgi:hypothetical protein